MPPFMIGQCCTDQILAPEVDPQEDISGKNEIVTFDNVALLVLAWTADRKARFGNAGAFFVEIQGPDGKYRDSKVEISPNDILDTTQYTFDFGGLATGRVTIT